MLIEKFKSPVVEDWLGKTKALELQSNTEEKDRIFGVLRQKLSYDVGIAALEAGEYRDAIRHFSSLLEDSKTPYFYKAHFARAAAYEGTKEYQNARGDYGEVSMAAMSAAKDGTYTEAQCRIGDTYLLENDLPKAYTTFNILAASVLAAAKIDTGGIARIRTKEVSKEEEDREKEWIEYAIFKTALCLAKMGKEDEKQKVIGDYLSKYPSGRFRLEIRNLPTAGAN
jgi:tetratricopeptide (TPR) repeat protein